MNGGGIIGHEITESVIRVNHRMSYNQVSRILDGDKELTVVYADAVKMFKEMKTLSDLLRKKRKERGGIDFDFPESKMNWMIGISRWIFIHMTEIRQRRSLRISC